MHVTLVKAQVDWLSAVRRHPCCFHVSVHLGSLDPDRSTTRTAQLGRAAYASSSDIEPFSAAAAALNTVRRHRPSTAHVFWKDLIVKSPFAVGGAGPFGRSAGEDGRARVESVNVYTMDPRGRAGGNIRYLRNPGW
jgi:hypothetical protein